MARMWAAESLPLADRSVDAVICECALCTFPNKPRAVAEFARVLRPGGRVGITDVTSTGHLPGLEGLVAWIACIVDARSVAEYRELLRDAAFHTDITEDHRDALVRLIDMVRACVVIGKALLSSTHTEAAGWDPRQTAAMAEAAINVVRSGDLGDALITAHVP
jgi:arsenite methyltransferase